MWLTLLALSHGMPAQAQSESRTFQVTVTGYCLQGVMRSGRYVYPGAVAVDPNVIPLGSRLRIDGLWREYVAEDTGGGVLGAHVDVWMASCDDAIEWGRQTREVEVFR